MERLYLALSLVLVACGSGELSSSPDANASRIDTRAQGDAQEDSTCTEGEPLCIDESAYTTCNAKGERDAATLCPAEQRCLDGHCRLALCEAGEARCASWKHRRVCDSGGLRWAPAEACPQDEVCYEGQCLTCVPNAPTCATLAASVTCSEDGQYFPMEAIASCDGEQHCHEPSGVCLMPSCTAEERRCAGTFGVHDCLASATGFSPEISPCGVEEICSEGRCAEVSCVPVPILFIVDRTGAVGGDWQAFQSAIQAAQNAHPSAAFGFMPFPMAFGCPSSGPGALPRFPIEYQAKIDTWFEEVSASAGEAALQHTFETVLLRAHEIFNTYKGKIVLISSGSAECESSPDALSAHVQSLRLDHQVQTYVIGHRASLGPYEALDAIHAAGGSGWDTWKESSYDLDLTQAILQALEGTPECALQSSTR